MNEDPAVHTCNKTFKKFNIKKCKTKRSCSYCDEIVSKEARFFPATHKLCHNGYYKISLVNF